MTPDRAEVIRAAVRAFNALELMDDRARQLDVRILRAGFYYGREQALEAAGLGA